ncbi:MAG: zinc ABC transporter substrate-binding protein [Planctomycetes bacterium]|nr:zinc ABC transporter substrate-binding protein [Planctomycetota bacterium]
MWKKAAACACIMLAACSEKTNVGEKGERITAAVSILPQAYFVKGVGGDRVNVEVMVGPGQSPETYEPTPKQIVRAGRADVYFRIGVAFEDTLVAKIGKGINVVDTRRGIKLREMKHGHVGHEETHGKVNGGAAKDPHIWLDPSLAAVQAETMAEELKRLDPEGTAYYEERLKAFRAEMDALDGEIRDILRAAAGKKFYVFHPAFGYFADRYGLTQETIEMEGKEPGAKQIVEIVDRAKAEGVKTIFVQSQFSTKAAEAIANAIGGTVVGIDPLEPDYGRGLRQMAEAIAEGLERRGDE